MVNIFTVLEAQKLLNWMDKYFFAQNQILCFSLEFWKNGGNASVWARGPGRNAPEASVGLPLISEDQSLFPPEEAEVFSPPPPRRNQRLMIPIPPLAGPRALEALGPYDAPFFKELKCYDIFYKVRENGLSRNRFGSRR